MKRENRIRLKKKKKKRRKKIFLYGSEEILEESRHFGAVELPATGLEIIMFLSAQIFVFRRSVSVSE